MKKKLVPFIVTGITCVAVFGIIIYGEMITNESKILITDLGSLQHTTLDQSFNYPENSPDIKVKFVEISPYTETSWHTHDTPLIATVLQGEIDVYYCTDEPVDSIDECNNSFVNHYTTNDIFVEAINTKHKGVNKGMIPVKIHAVTLDVVD